MRQDRRDRRDQGQVFPALLLVVVLLVFLALAFAQLGSAATEKTGAQTAADAAAVAVGQASRDLAVLDAARALRGDRSVPPGYFDRLPDGKELRDWSRIACSTAGAGNWNANHARKDRLTCRSALRLSLPARPGLVRVDLMSPAGVVADGPAADTSRLRVEATATTEVAATCPRRADRDPVAILLHRLVNEAMKDLRAQGVCPPDSTRPPKPGRVSAAPPPATELLDIVRDNLLVRLTADR